MMNMMLQLFALWFSSIVVVTSATTTLSLSADEYPPQLLSYSIDCGFGKISLQFNSLIIANTMNVKGIAFQPVPHLSNNSTVSLSSSISLTSSFNNLASQGNTSTLVIYLNSDDYARLLIASSGFFLSSASIYLSLANNTVFSTFGIAVQDIPQTDALLVSSYVKDTFPPFLLSFELNMNTGNIFLTFSEPIHASSFHLNGLMIQGMSYLGDKKQGYAIVEFNGPYVKLIDTDKSYFVKTNNQGKTICYHLGEDNLTPIQSIANLARSIDTSYISASSAFVQDLSGTQSPSLLMLMRMLLLLILLLLLFFRTIYTMNHDAATDDEDDEDDDDLDHSDINSPPVC